MATMKPPLAARAFGHLARGFNLSELARSDSIEQPGSGSVWGSSLAPVEIETTSRGCYAALSSSESNMTSTNKMTDDELGHLMGKGSLYITGHNPIVWLASYEELAFILFLIPNILSFRDISANTHGSYYNEVLQMYMKELPAMNYLAQILGKKSLFLELCVMNGAKEMDDEINFRHRNISFSSFGSDLSRIAYTVCPSQLVGELVVGGRELRRHFAWRLS
ncbi:hypothetical protein Syun_019044 [Stephania yunnanensis]|uniref:Uncharacterized protein n=1 Tax=Stephania yunnanensis TaxID=152371 RepID=A0AAP0IVC0_9MAGN